MMDEWNEFLMLYKSFVMIQPNFCDHSLNRNIAILIIERNTKTKLLSENVDLFRFKKQTSKSVWYDGFSLVNCNICYRYSVTVSSRFDILQETSERLTPNDNKTLSLPP